jgi:hypothetical protein
VDFSKPNNFFPESMSFVTKPKVGPNRLGISIKKFENKQKNS